MAGEVAREISSENAKIKEHCVDTGPCHDLPNGGSGDCNGVKSEAVVEGIENGNGKEEADRTYVFVNGSDSVADAGDNGYSVKWALVEECTENYGELKLNGETDAGEAKVNGCNGHCCSEGVAAVSNEAVQVGTGKDMNDENGDREMEMTNLLAVEDPKGESDKLGPVEELDGVNSSESESLGVYSCEKEFEVESFEVVERVPESLEDHGDAVCSSDCKEPTGNSEELPEQVESRGEIVKEVSESRAANDEETEGSGDCSGPVEITAVLSDKAECTSEFTAVISVKAECTSDFSEAVSESHQDVNGLDYTKESSKITEQLPLQVESNSEVVEEVPNSQSVSHADAGCSIDSKESLESLEHAVSLPVQAESSTVVEGIPESQAVSLADVEVTVDCKEQSENTVEKEVLLSKHVSENQNEFIITDTAASEMNIRENVEDQVVEDRESDPIKTEKVEESRQLGSNADIQENQESMKVQAGHDNNDVEQEDLVELAAESSAIDQQRNTDGDHDQIAESSAGFWSSDIDTARTKSPTEHSQCLETSPFLAQLSVTTADGDSDDASLDTKEQDAALASAEKLASSADCSNEPVESAETVETLDADVAKRSLSVDYDISSPALDDGEAPAELEVVNDAKEPVLEIELGKGEAAGSDYAEAESGAQYGSTAGNDISTSLCTTKPVEIKICFGSISHEELSSLSIGGRSSEAKSVVDAAVSQPSPVMEYLVNDGNDKSTSRGAEVVDAVPQSDEVSPAEGSIVGVPDTKPVVPEVRNRFFNYLVRLPRYDGELNTQIRDAQAQVEEKTRIRDAIKAEIHMIKATRKEYLVELEAASAEERSARESLKSKWQEFDSVQSVVNKVKNAMSIDDINNRIHSMEHRIEHETMRLNEEKQLLREIKQLKQLREQLSANMGKQDELKEALEQKEQAEERLKVLRKEAELLRGNVSRAEVVTKAVKKKHYDGNGKLQELQAQFNAADAVRQEAYNQLRSLRIQLKEKNEYFNKYKDGIMILNGLASKGDRDRVSQFCIKQVEEFMKLWNDNAGFRSNYMDWSLKGTMRRLGTKDGRSLGVDEQPTSLPSYQSERVVKDKPTPAFPSLAQTLARAAPVEAVPSANNVPVKPVEQKKQNSKAKAPAKPSEAVDSASSVTIRDVEVAEVIEEPKQTKEEEEKARKEDELRREEEAARLKEQHRLEEKAKAEAALEKKKRNAERAQARAEAKAQKEAEQKEKEREKRLKKKERKKAAVVSAPADNTIEGEPTPSAQGPMETPMETPKEPETMEKVETAAKRPQKPTRFTKQIKVMSTIPPPLRNRGKRKMSLWMWVLLIAAIVLALFFAGNIRQLF